MKYFEATFTISPYSADASDILAAIAGEVGFETFEETVTGLKGYIQQQLFNEASLNEALKDFPFEETTITYEIKEAEDRDWNEQWEQEGFEPIVVSENLIIHDGRHLPSSVSSECTQIEIDAHLAFGTGTHETTRMICNTIQSLPLKGTKVLDCGTGTGILSICALKFGASEAVGYDIDEWSVDNARHNAIINQVDDRFTSLLGDASVLDKIDGTFGLITANINRNILMADLPQFRKKMTKGSTLILSGFYTNDCEQLIEKAKSLGLTLKQQKADHDWACLMFIC
ncbi:ribosomal protein L11 methyltransferase [Prevotella sp. khp7]|uniref:50S ribosomal protein L11 methyltransferase n=1 Tax=Prevotella sp. khp7 TaxID=1761885 RepID=UPI0008AFC965|nr:50S ribosomal protein L11 methyltransferase [Prevotella sp. khp7]SEV82667.1 ribosomal protein L11 methyltransferase [Prevotella sp. khp7]